MKVFFFSKIGVGVLFRKKFSGYWKRAKKYQSWEIFVQNVLEQFSFEKFIYRQMGWKRERLCSSLVSQICSFSLNPPGSIDTWIHFTASYVFYSVPGLILSHPPGTFPKLSCAWHWCWSDPVSYQRTRQHLWLQYRKSTRQRTTRQFRWGTHPLGAKYVRQRAQHRWPSGTPLGTCARRVPVGGCWDL